MKLDRDNLELEKPEKGQTYEGIYLKSIQLTLTEYENNQLSMRKTIKKIKKDIKDWSENNNV